MDHDLVSLQVENFSYNSLNLNLQLTAVISKLASFPQVKANKETTFVLKKTFLFYTGNYFPSL